MISRRAPAIAIALLVAAALGAGIYLRLNQEEAGEPSASEIVQGIAPSATAALTGDIAIPVSGEAAERKALVISVTASGQAEAWRRTVITPLVAGRISALAARENARVAEDAPLAILDPVEFEMRVQEARAQLRSAEASYRELTLFDDGISDPAVRAERESFLRVRSGLESAELAVRRAEMELSRTRVTSPIGGRVADVKVIPGEWVSPSTELMTIVDLDPIRVEVQVQEGQVGYLSTGRTARVSFSAFPGETFTGRIESINPVVEAGTRTARVTVLVPNPAGKILPGMFARVSMEAQEFADRVLVPRTAILERDRRKLVFVFDPTDRGGRAKWRYVTTGLENDTHVEILCCTETDSVRAGEVVLTDGHYTLIHDARVSVTTAERP